jgi:hypothetical protein
MDGDLSPGDFDRKRLREAITDVQFCQSSNAAISTTVDKEEKPAAEYARFHIAKREWRHNQPKPAGPGVINVEEWNSRHSTLVEERGIRQVSSKNVRTAASRRMPSKISLVMDGWRGIDINQKAHTLVTTPLDRRPNLSFLQKRRALDSYQSNTIARWRSVVSA